MGGEVGGTVASMFVPGGAAVKTPTLMGRIARGARTAGAIGATSGALSTEGGVKERAKGAAIGGSLGAGLGAAAVPAIEAVPRVMHSAGKAADYLVRGPAAAGPAVGAGAGFMFSGGDIDNRLRGAAYGAGAGVLARQAGSRIMGARKEFVPLLEKATGIARTNVPEETHVLSELRDEAAHDAFQPLWQQFNQPITDTKVLALLDKKPSLRRAFKKAIETTQEFGEEVPVVTTASGNKVTQRIAPTPQMLHFTKVELRKEIERLKAGLPADKLSSSNIASRERTFHTLRTALEKLVPGYGDAAEKYGLESRGIERLNEGFQAWSKGADAAEAALKRIKAPDEIQAFKTGLANRAYQTIGKQTTKVDLNEWFGSPDKQRLLRILFPDDASYQAFVEEALSGTFKTGPKTIRAERAATQLIGRTPMLIQRLMGGSGQ